MDHHAFVQGQGTGKLLPLKNGFFLLFRLEQNCIIGKPSSFRPSLLFNEKKQPLFSSISHITAFREPAGKQALTLSRLLKTSHWHRTLCRLEFPDEKSSQPLSDLELYRQHWVLKAFVYSLGCLLYANGHRAIAFAQGHVNNTCITETSQLVRSLLSTTSFPGKVLPYKQADIWPHHGVKPIGLQNTYQTAT